MRISKLKVAFTTNIFNFINFNIFVSIYMVSKLMFKEYFNAK